MLRQAVSIAQQQEANAGNMVASIAFCILGCLIGIVDWAVQYVVISCEKRDYENFLTMPF